MPNWTRNAKNLWFSLCSISMYKQYIYLHFSSIHGEVTQHWSCIIFHVKYGFDIISIVEIKKVLIKADL